MCFEIMTMWNEMKERVINIDIWKKYNIKIFTLNYAKNI